MEGRIGSKFVVKEFFACTLGRQGAVVHPHLFGALIFTVTPVIEYRMGYKPRLPTWQGVASGHFRVPLSVHADVARSCVCEHSGLLRIPADSWLTLVPRAGSASTILVLKQTTLADSWLTRFHGRDVPAVC
jgi:hypothetical protein